MVKSLYQSFGVDIEWFLKVLSFGREGRVGFMIGSYMSAMTTSGVLVDFRPN